VWTIQQVNAVEIGHDRATTNSLHNVELDCIWLSVLYVVRPGAPIQSGVI
jgi:hypothetical protein